MELAGLNTGMWYSPAETGTGAPDRGTHRKEFTVTTAGQRTSVSDSGHGFCVGGD